MKRILLIVVWIVALVVSVHALDVPELQGYVNDYAGLISPDVKSRMEEKLNALERTSSTQIFILTIPTLEDEVLEEFAPKVFRVWKTGASKLDNGVILIVAQKEGKIRIEAGRGQKGKMTDLAAGKIIIDTVMAPKFKGGDYETGIMDGIDALIPVLKGQYSASVLRDFWGGSFIRYLSENSVAVVYYSLLMMMGVRLISSLIKLLRIDEFLMVVRSKAQGGSGDAQAGATYASRGRKKRPKWIFGALTGAVCGPVAAYWMMAETSLVAWLFYVCSGALFGIIGMYVRFSSSTSGSSGSSSSSGSSGGFSGGGGSSGGGGASGDY
ncbi:MAG: hypothetical protein C0402_08460 [Thermodesulfovibrio sp.]|nr:hypothetical protein [Thermodesulfovibrio sp.]